MKTRFILILSTLLLGSAAATAKSQSPENRDCVVVSATMHCDKCVSKIENAIPFEKGVKDVKIDFDEQKVTVDYDPRRTDEEKIIKAFEKIKVPAKIQEPEGDLRR